MQYFDVVYWSRALRVILVVLAEPFILLFFPTVIQSDEHTLYSGEF